VNAVVTLIPSHEEWLSRCARRLQHLGPLFTDEQAADIAADLHRAWPQMRPKFAAETFLSPEQIAAFSSQTDQRHQVATLRKRWSITARPFRDRDPA